MIFTERTIRVSNGTSSISSPIILYKGDKNIKIRFKIVDCPYTYSKNVDNIIETSEASYAQLIIKTPNNGTPILSDITEPENGYVTFIITGEMIDEAKEVGKYSLQVRLLDDEQYGRITIPEVVDGIEVREPMVTEGVSTTNEVDVAVVDYAVTTTATAENAFDSEGNYIETNWQSGNVITSAKLNKIEKGITGVNQKIGNVGTGSSSLTKAQITALDNMFKVCAYTSQDISTQYEAFKSAFGIEDTPTDKTLTSISVEYTGGDVAVGTALTDLTGITVTATYSDNSTAIVTDYTLSGSIVEGTNTITVTYQGKTTSFTVTGVSQSTTNNILQPFASYKLNSVLKPMHTITQSGNDYTFAINSEYTGNVTFQNSRAISPTPLTNGTTYKLSVSESITTPIYVYGVDSIPESTDAEAAVYSGTLIGTFTANTTEYTFTPEANYAGLRLAIVATTDITLKDLILEEV